MAKESSKKSFLDFFKMKELDEDEFDDDLFDEDEDDDEDDEDYAPVKPARNKKQASRKPQSNYQSGYNQGPQAYNQTQYNNYNQKPQRVPQQQNNRVVEFSNQRPRPQQGSSEVYVMIPHDPSECQTVTDFLKAGKTIVLNMAGVDIKVAQGIIDFVAGSTYALDGTLKPISENIFIAAPNSIAISGDLRQMFDDDSVAANLYRF